MTPPTLRIALIIVCTWLFYYVILRFFVIFNCKSKLIPLIIAVVLACMCIWAFLYQWEHKVLDIIATFAWWLFVLTFILFLILVIEHIIWIWYKVNPRVFIWIIITVLWLWTYFSLCTKIINLDIQSDKIENNVKILLVSDIHAENVTQDYHIKKIIKTIELEKPDFVIIAWDLMNKPNSSYVNYFSTFKSVKNIPIFAVMWNHDVMGNTEIIKEIPDISGIRFLNNEKFIIDWVQLVWAIDKSLWWQEFLIDKIWLNEDSDLFTIFVTHQPISLEKLKNYPIDLEVAWHTHRGQFYGMRKVAQLSNDYLYGEYKLWDKVAFVTQWIWTWGLPFRLWTQSEIVIINLINK